MYSDQKILFISSAAEKSTLQKLNQGEESHIMRDCLSEATRPLAKNNLLLELKK